MDVPIFWYDRRLDYKIFVLIPTRLKTAIFENTKFPIHPTVALQHTSTKSTLSLENLITSRPSRFLILFFDWIIQFGYIYVPYNSNQLSVLFKPNKCKIEMDRQEVSGYLAAIFFFLVLRHRLLSWLYNSCLVSFSLMHKCNLCTVEPIKSWSLYRLTCLISFGFWNWVSAIGICDIILRLVGGIDGFN